MPISLITANSQGGAPAFSAYLNTPQSLSNSTNTLITINSKVFDTNTCFNNTGSTVTLNGISTPAYAFAPNLAGYYSVSVGVAGPGSAAGACGTILYKNGSTYQYGGSVQNATFGVVSVGSFLVYLNGSSDYIQFYVQQTTGGTASMYGQASAPYWTYFQASFLRSA